MCIRDSNRPYIRHQFSGRRIDNRLSQDLADKPTLQPKLFIIFITADPGKIIPARVKKQAVNVGLGAFDSRRFTGTQLPVNFEERFFHRFTGILFDGCAHPIIVTEEVENLSIGAQTQAADKNRNRNLTVFILSLIHI